MIARTLFSIHPAARIAAICMAGALLFAACGQIDIGIPPDPLTRTTGKAVNATTTERDIWNNLPPGTPLPPGTFPRNAHLSPCNAASDCFAGTNCVNLFGAPLCFFRCDPTKASSDKQNPDCIEPENCIKLTDGSGVCVAMPGQLYGIGSYKAIVRHKQGQQCLLRYGGCEEGLICVDTTKKGSTGTCEEACIPKLNIPGNQNEPNCQTAGTTCKELSSGIGACLK